MRRALIHNSKLFVAERKSFLGSIGGSLSASLSSSSTTGGTDKGRFLHISPSGDTWIGDEIFAAKHLQTGYLRSIHISVEEDVELEERIEVWCNGLSVAELQGIYDSGKVEDGIFDSK